MKRCLGCMQSYQNELTMCPHCGYVENTSPEEAIHMVPGTILQDRFIIGKVVGCGGFGVTYIAWDQVLDHKVAIKEYLPSEFSTRMPSVTHLTIFEGDKTEQFGDGMTKFLDEARRLAKFQNESGIVKILDCFEENRTAYIVMEYLQGVTLTHYLEEHGKIQEDEAVQMILPILNSLKKVHAEGIIHRDIAPDNIMVTTDGQVKLIDFGAARYATTSHSRSLTVIIKQGYSPIEQYQSRGDQGAYTDVYAMGAVLYKMITGVTPPDSMERNAYFENSHKDILEPIHKLVKGISENRENAILNSMNIRIEDRSPDMDSLIKELTTDESVARINGKIKKKDIFEWPLWSKITIPMAMMAVIVLFVLLITGVIGFDFKKPREIIVPDGMTRVPRIVSMDEDTAKSTLSEKKLNYTVVGIKNDETIEKGCVLTQNVSVGSIVSINYTVEVIISAGKEHIEVPYLIGTSKENALQELGNNFVYEIVEDYDSVIENGYVINQSIDGGMEVDKGSNIILTISKGRNPECEYLFEKGEMPDLVGLTFVEALNTCEKLGIKLIVGSYQHSTEYDGMCVLKQDISKGEYIEKDMIVEIVLSKGPQVFKVPYILYLAEEEAVEKLETRDLKYELVYEESDNVAKGYVVSQSIASGTIIDKKDVIKVVISTGPSMFDMIDVIGLTESEAIMKLQELGLVVDISYGYDKDVKSGTVISQSKQAYDKVYKGCEIEIVVCSNDSLIEVPNCVGEYYYVAAKQLEELGFVVEYNVIEDTQYDYEIVSNQNPKAGSFQKPGTKIIVTYKNKQTIIEETTNEVIEETTNEVIEETTNEVIEETTEAIIEIETTQENTTEETITNNEIEFVIPEGATFTSHYTGKTYSAGETFKGVLLSLDVYITEEYNYMFYDYGDDKKEYTGWTAYANDRTKTHYGKIESTVLGKPVTRVYFGEITTMVVAPEIPETVTNLNCAFSGCINLKDVSGIPDSVVDMTRTFEGCISLAGTVSINANPLEYESCFQGVDFTAQNLTLSGTSTMLDDLRATGDN